GFAVLTLSLFSGFIFVQDLFAQNLSRKTILSCLAWIVFAILLFGRWRFGWRGRTAVRWTLSGFALLVLAYFGSKIVLESILGRHWG
ncbi:MAG TPA: cytochrome c biogenesis protein CcsA, partial [Povalibacter sp.]|nr:cytochrome c biogenesis protein CcsA [Povalibacter sp.]